MISFPDERLNIALQQENTYILFDKIEHSNLRFAIIENLWRENILSRPSAGDMNNAVSPDRDIKEDKPIAEVEEYLLAMEVSDKDLLDLTNLTWDENSIIARMIWPSWDGEDDYFHIEYLEGIEVLKNLKSIKGNLFAFDNAEPLALLCNLETIDIENELFADFVSYPVMKLAPLLDIMKLKSLRITAEPVPENKKAEQELQEEVPHVNITWRKASPLVEAERLYNQITFSTPAEEKLEMLNRIIDLGPELQTYYSERAQVYFYKMEDTGKALEDINRAIELSKADNYPVKNLSLRAEIYKKLGEYERAVSDYTRAINLSKDKSQVAPEIKDRAQTYKLLKKYDRAIADYYLFIETADQGSIYYKIYLELLEMYIFTNDYTSGESLLKNHAIDFTSVNETLVSRFEGLFSLLKYILSLYRGSEAQYDFNRLKDIKHWKWDYSFLEEWLTGNEFDESDNEIIWQIITQLKK